MNPELKALAERLEEVEKQVAHLAALVTEQSDTDRTVVARGLVIRDEEGRRRAHLGLMVPAGQTKALPCLALFDKEEEPRAILGIEEQGPTLQLTYGTDKAVNITIGKNGPEVVLYSPDGKACLWLKTTNEGAPVLGMRDGNGETRLALLLGSSGEPAIQLHDANGSPSVVVIAGKDGPSVCLLDPKNRQGNTSIRIEFEGDEPSLLCVKDGNVLWSAPYRADGKAPSDVLATLSNEELEQRAELEQRNLGPLREKLAPPRKQ